MASRFRTPAWIDRVPVARQLYGGFFAMVVLTALVGALALVGLARVESQARALSEKWLQGVGHLSEARAALVDGRDFEVKHSRTDDKSYHAEYEDKVAEAAKTVGKALLQYGERVSGDDEKALFDKVGKSWSAYQSAQKKVLEFGRNGKKQDAADISDGLANMAFDETVGGLNKLTDFNFEGGRTSAASVASVYKSAQLLVVALLGAALLAGIGLAALITRHLLAQLGGEPHTAVAVAQAVAGGDLGTEIRLRPGDTTSLMASLCAMQRGLAEAVTHVRSGSEQVAASSQQIAQGNNDLAGRTEQQASALQLTAATMDELSTTVRNNADNARQASQLAEGASAVAVKGGDVVGQVVQTMRGINASSKKIADIIAVIDGIAFQTNILALNAAVEAARAGEQGRGFAVVAGEVRNLARRSAEAAKEIKTLITASVDRVDHGTTLVDQAGKTMEEIVGAIRRVTDIVAEISSASAEQSAGVAQVGQAITQMDQGTQQNAALVEQSSAAAESLKQQAEQLVRAVAVFRIGSRDAAPARSTVTPAHAHASAERRGPDRAKNVVRLPAAARAPKSDTVDGAVAVPAPAPARTGTEDWETF